MNIVSKITEAVPVSVEIANNPASLNAIHQKGCAAVVWSRQTPPEIQTWIDDLPPKYLPSGRVIITPEMIAETVKDLFDAVGMLSGSEREWLHADITSLAGTFSRLMSAKYLRLRLDVVTNNACLKFHVDAVTSRLICTYRGSGTQYGLSTNGSDPTRIFQAKTGSPILLRGTLWPAKSPVELRHRSPPIEGTGETRLVLVLDPVSNLEEEM
ncbi:MAG: DUF1826 domain-containing protein [Aestuariivita sp.]|nr:DUF1826 domain-containing protein [Aestuariivita sp.]